MPSPRAGQRRERRGRHLRAAVWLVLWAGAGCETVPPTAPPPVTRSVPVSVTIPQSVQRLAVVSRGPADRDEREAYERLEGAAFQLKEVRSSLRIVEREDLARILTEQRRHMTGSVSEDTAIRVGRLLGADSVLLYEIFGPSLRDRMLANRSDDLPPLIITSKIIRVESAEVVFHNVVTAAVGGPAAGEVGRFPRRAAVTPLIRAALTRGVDHTIADLRRAFR